MQLRSQLRSPYITNHRALATNAIWNLIGQVVPLIAAIFAIPELVRELGLGRFGVLTLAWMVIGYFSLFDLGIGRALTKEVAERLGRDQRAEIPDLVWTALILMVLLGALGAIIVGSFSHWLVYYALKIPGVLHEETRAAVYLLALSLPVVVSTAGLRGVLEAYQRFGLVNLLRIPMGLFTFLGPLLVLPFSKNLEVVVAVLVIGRLVAWVAHIVFCMRVVLAFRCTLHFRYKFLGPLFRFGGWLTITNIVGPLMVYMDRFLIGAVLSVVAVAYYTAPYEVVTKLLLIPSAITGVLFPAFAASYATKPYHAYELFVHGLKTIFLLLFPITLVLVTFAHEGLSFWLGDDFAENGAQVLQWLAAGVLVNSLAQVPFALVQAAGRPDLTAKLHLVELPFYLLLLWFLSTRIGIQGVAIAWMVRAVVDMLFLFWLAGQSLVALKKSIFPMSVTLLVALATLAISGVLTGVVIKSAFVLLTLGVGVMFSWFWILRAQDRQIIAHVLGSWWVKVKACL